ncbi:MAG: ABC transporter permease [Anaerolineae bacterium]|nr:ABC transporter permease [Anaerolineae bacterium]
MTIADPSPQSTRLPFNIAALVFVRERGIIVLWVLLLIFFAIYDHPYFASVSNFLLILNAASLTAVFAAGVGIGAISGTLDLSVAGVAAFSSVVAGKLIILGYPVWLALIAGMSVGILAGFVNGLITRRGLNPLVVTIGTLSMLSGLAAVVADGYTIPGLSKLTFMGTARYFGIPAHVYIVTVVYLIGTIFLTKTRDGIRLVAVGGNPEAVRRVGINSARYQLLGFVLCGACSALGGLMTAALVTEASPQANPGSIFEALTAVALSGVSLGGGRGSLPKVFVGAAILATISNGLTIAGVPPYWATVTTGVLLISALVIDRTLTRTISERLVVMSGHISHPKKP